MCVCVVLFFQAEDGIRDLVRSRGLGDVYKRQELWDFENYQEKFKSFSYGIQGGLGLDIWNFRFDVQYENNLKQLGTQVNIGGRDILLSPNASRFLFTLGYRF